jgi:hypothetical protein
MVLLPLRTHTAVSSEPLDQVELDIDRSSQSARQQATITLSDTLSSFVTTILSHRSTLHLPNLIDSPSPLPHDC